MTFYNTVGAVQQELDFLTNRATNQNELVLLIFKENKGKWLTPGAVHREVLRRTPKPCPVTSIRRSISSLTSDGILIKSDLALIVGEYGVKTHSWTLR